MDACICLNSTAVKKIFNGTKNTRLLFFWKEWLCDLLLRGKSRKQSICVIEEYFLEIKYLNSNTISSFSDIPEASHWTSDSIFISIKWE